MMRFIFFFFIFFFFIFSPVNGQFISWMTLEEALSAQKNIPKKIIIDVYTDWCGPCKTMDTKTFGNKYIAEYINEYYYAVKFNAEGNEEIYFFDQKFINPDYQPIKKGRNGTHQLTHFLQVKGYPTVVFLSEEGDPIMPIIGYHNVQELELYLKLIKQGDYSIFSTPKDFEKYKKYFKPKFID